MSAYAYAYALERTSLKVFVSISTDPPKTTSPLPVNVTVRNGDQNGKRPQMADNLYSTSRLYYHVTKLQLLGQIQLVLPHNGF